MRRTSCSFFTHIAPPARRGRRIHAVRELWQGNRPARTKMPLCWQDVADMRSQALDDGKMLAKCVPSVRWWQDRALMRSWPDWQWQYTRAVRPPKCLFVARSCHGAFPCACRWKNAREMRSRAAIRGKFCAPCIPKVASDGKIASSWQHIAAVYPK